MNAERTIESRVARHAALADVVRLRIVDSLTIGDRSPGELERDLGISSNLLAHHLNVLQNAGLIVRSRSEADRRRSYVRLDSSGLLSEQQVAPVLSARRVVFVCTANSARSHLAAALWSRASAVPAASGGTHPADHVEAGAVSVARRHGLDLADSRPRLLDDVLRTGDLLVTVCDNAHEELALTDLIHWSVPDPVRSTTTSAFDDAYVELARRVGDLAPRVAAA